MRSFFAHLFRPLAAAVLGRGDGRSRAVRCGVGMRDSRVGQVGREHAGQERRGRRDVDSRDRCRRGNGSKCHGLRLGLQHRRRRRHRLLLLLRVRDDDDGSLSLDVGVQERVEHRQLGVGDGREGHAGGEEGLRCSCCGRSSGRRSRSSSGSSSRNCSGGRNGRERAGRSRRERVEPGRRRVRSRRQGSRGDATHGLRGLGSGECTRGGRRGGAKVGVEWTQEKKPKQNCFRCERGKKTRVALFFGLCSEKKRQERPSFSLSLSRSLFSVSLSASLLEDRFVDEHCPNTQDLFCTRRRIEKRLRRYRRVEVGERRREEVKDKKKLALSLFPRRGDGGSSGKKKRQKKGQCRSRAAWSPGLPGKSGTLCASPWARILVDHSKWCVHFRFGGDRSWEEG